MQTRATLVLADGSVFQGISIGSSDAIAVGEVVFNTSMTGYQEILTDPSYCGQLVTLTYPHIGNTGVNSEDAESDHIQAAGLIVRDVPTLMHHFRAERSLNDYLKSEKIAAIADIDTRRLTRILRDGGNQAGCIFSGEALTIEEAQERALSFGSMAGKDLASQVSTPQPYTWTEGEWHLPQGFNMPENHPFHVVAYDFGVKRNILRMLAQRGCRVTVVPAATSAKEALALSPDGIFLSNGPGDPEPCDYAVAAVREFLAAKIPLFGICLGHQLLGLALGGKTQKMKFGHHGANHPVQDLATGNVLITSQNHGFEIADDSLPDNVTVTHRSLFDGSLQGLRVNDAPAFSFQGHPEASAGPHDVAALFNQFIDAMRQRAV